MTETPVVRVAQGALRGRRVASQAGGTFYSFQGVPYAQPPVGPLRFKVAQPVQPWDGVRDALKEGPPCPQIEWIMKLPYRGDEDCLYLNVYTTKLPSANQAVKRPVMVWIHGGGFEIGSGDTDMYGPDFLVAEDVVVVTINYRLSIFGFLCLDDECHPNNLGLKDQVAALRWVKENVGAFGGDANNVTIFGESAGANSVNCHLLSPMTKGLFHKAIIQSGGVLFPWSTSCEPKTLALALAKELGCNSTNVEEVLEFFKTVPARDLIEMLENIDKQKAVWKERRFGVTVEKQVRSGEEVFLPEDPKEMMKKGKFQSVPCIVGMTSSEGIIATELSGVSMNPQALKIFVQNLETYIPQDIVPKSTSNEVVKKVKEFYFQKDVIEKSIAGFVDFMSDVLLTRGTDQIVNILSRGTSPIYYYCFDYVGELNIYKKFIGADNLSGASHLDEIGYLFTTSFFKVPKVDPNSSDGVARKRMVKLWTNFAKIGNPTPGLDPPIDIQWPSFTSDNPQYLDISDELRVKKNLYKERLDFWNNL